MGEGARLRGVKSQNLIENRAWHNWINELISGTEIEILIVEKGEG